MSELALQTHNLTKYYGKSKALDHLNIEIPIGCVYGLLGRNGAGKTTAIKIMLGFTEPTTGTAQVLGCDCQNLSPQVRAKIGYVTEGHHLFRWMKIYELEKFQKTFFPGQWNERLFQDMLDYFELPQKRKVKNLSNGQRAQVSLALAMAPNPDLLIMDDPTLGLDTVIRRQFLEGMIQLIQRQNKTILFSSHILSDVERVVDRIAVLDKGVLRADCSLEEFQSSVKKVKLSFLGEIPGTVDIPGVLHQRQGEKELELTLIATKEETLAQWAEEFGATQYKYLEMNLEDQFIEFTGTHSNKRLFQWEEN